MVDIPKARAVMRKLRKNLDAVTEGPWTPSWAVDRLSSEANPFYRFEARGPQVGCAREGTAHYDDLARRTQADAEHIAQCSPENIRTLLDYIKELDYECRKSMGEIAILRAELDARPRRAQKPHRNNSDQPQRT